jgi:hypothetical protein
MDTNLATVAGVLLIAASLCGLAALALGRRSHQPRRATRRVAARAEAERTAAPALPEPAASPAAPVHAPAGTIAAEPTEPAVASASASAAPVDASPAPTAATTPPPRIEPPRAQPAFGFAAAPKISTAKASARHVVSADVVKRSAPPASTLVETTRQSLLGAIAEAIARQDEADADARSHATGDAPAERPPAEPSPAPAERAAVPAAEPREAAPAEAARPSSPLEPCADGGDVAAAADDGAVTAAPMSRGELYRLASELGIEGRSQMSRQELTAAVAARQRIRDRRRQAAKSRNGGAEAARDVGAAAQDRGVLH